MYQDIDEVARDLALTDEDHDLLESFLGAAAYERPDGTRYVTPEVIGKAMARVGDTPWRFLWRAMGCCTQGRGGDALSWAEFAGHFFNWEGFDVREQEYFSLLRDLCIVAIRELRLHRDSVNRTTEIIQERVHERIKAN